MQSSLSAIILALVLATSAVAQDVSPLQRAIDTLPKPVTSEQLVKLATDNPNAYVYFVQDFLAGRGMLKGPADGQLKTVTVKALLAYCRERGIETACGAGPLLTESVAAVSGAIVADLVPVLPQGWRIADNGKGGSLGLKIDLVSAGPASAVLHFSGTTAHEGYINVELSPVLTSTPGNWVTSVTAGNQRAEGKPGGDLWLRTAVLDTYGYAGELFEGARLPEGAEAQRISESGTPKEGATQLLPYVQLWVRQGEEIDTTLTLADPSFVKQ
jgi:hypothetical protein